MGHSEHSCCSSHCIGDNFLPSTAWIYRSCHYQHICWDDSVEEWTFYPSMTQKSLQKDSSTNDFFHSAQSATTLEETQLEVSLLGSNPYFVRKHKHSWAPRVKWPNTVPQPSRPHQHHHQQQHAWHSNPGNVQGREGPENIHNSSRSERHSLRHCDTCDTSIFLVAKTSFTSLQNGLRSINNL